MKQDMMKGQKGTEQAPIRSRSKLQGLQQKRIWQKQADRKELKEELRTKRPEWWYRGNKAKKKPWTYRRDWHWQILWEKKQPAGLFRLCGISVRKDEMQEANTT